MAKILVVEDESIVAMDIKKRLKRLGYEVAGTASTGEGAVEMAALTRPNMVLMDIMLKGDMDGIKAAGMIRDRLDIPVVYLTAFSDEDTLQRAKVTGPFGYLIKPFEERELHVTLEIALYTHGIEQSLKESREELKRARDDLEIKVEERTAMLADSNRALQEEIFERKKAENELKRRLEFEDIITALSTNFINIGLDDIDAGITDTLRKAGVFTGIDRCYVFLFSDDLSRMDNTHEWCAGGISPQIDSLKGLLTAAYPWWMEQLRNFKDIYIPRVSELPEEALPEKTILKAQSIQSLLAIPMIQEDRLIGYIGFDSVRMEKEWSEEDIKLLRITGELLTTVLSRKCRESERAMLIKELGAKNAEMERFTYTVSHDLRSPLITIQGFMGFLKNDILQNDKKRCNEDIKMVEDAVKKMDALLADTLELSRIGRATNPPQYAPYKEIVDDALSQIAEKIRSHNVDVQVEDDLPVVNVDRLRIMEVLVNLIDNSIKYMGAQKEPRIEIGWMAEGKDGNPETADQHRAVFFVSDNGMGIDPAHHEKVFELFYKLDRKSQGSGAGLAIVKRIIEVQGGRIWIESFFGKGCKMCFTLPLAKS